jgi:glycosyltransferase involved in cell wall biosynthesis
VSSPSVPLVSVVVIFKDAERFLSEAIDSVLNQTHMPHEILLVDDGSVDGSRRIAEKLANDHPVIKILEHQGGTNRGMGASRLVGIHAASSVLIAFLDADDRWDPTHLAMYVEAWSNCDGVAMVVGRAVEWFSWGSEVHNDLVTPLPFAPGIIADPPDLLTTILNRGAFATPICSVLVEKSALLRGDGISAQFEGMYEDQVLLAAVQINCKAVFVRAATAYYRKHSASASALAEADGTYHSSLPNESRFRYLEWLGEFLDSSNVRSRRDLIDALEMAKSGLEGGQMNETKNVSAIRLIAHWSDRVAGGRLSTFQRSIRRKLRIRSLLLSTQSEEPISRDFGFDLGTPIDRVYIERFLQECALDIQGDVLEVGSNEYTVRYGGSRVNRSFILRGNLGTSAAIEGTPIEGDLEDELCLGEALYDCLIVTQTLHLIWNSRNAMNSMYRALRPGGMLLLTVPGISPISRDRWSEQWFCSYTARGLIKLGLEAFEPDAIEVRSWGNAAAATGFLQGLPAEELEKRFLDPVDEQYPVLISLRGWKENVS